MERLVAGVRRFEFDAYLAPYDLSSFATWQQLSNHISAGARNALVTFLPCPVLSCPVRSCKSGRNAVLQRADIGTYNAVDTGQIHDTAQKSWTMIA